jgi:hypothetical protein
MLVGVGVLMKNKRLKSVHNAVWEGLISFEDTDGTLDALDIDIQFSSGDYDSIIWVYDIDLETGIVYNSAYCSGGLLDEELPN